MKQRLQKLLAAAGICSRRAAETYITAGRVTVNGQVAALGDGADPETDRVELDGKPVALGGQEFRYLMLHKPVGYVCSKTRQGDTPTIYELLPKEYASLKTVGRLDKDSSGLILFTNDGDFAYQMTHPKFTKTKVYNVELSRDLEPLHQQMISDFGIELPDGRSRLGLSRLRANDRKGFEVTMSEGRNRQIRRTFAALGYEVKKLHRVAFGKYSLGELKPGEFREVKP